MFPLASGDVAKQADVGSCCFTMSGLDKQPEF